MEDITKRFLAAVEAVTKEEVSIRELCDKTGIDRRNLMRLCKEPETYSPRPMWLVRLCECFHVSPDFLMLGKGCILKK